MDLCKTNEDKLRYLKDEIFRIQSRLETLFAGDLKTRERVLVSFYKAVLKAANNHEDMTLEKWGAFNSFLNVQQ